MKTALNRRQFIRTTGAATLAAVAAPRAYAQAEKSVTLAFVGCAHIHTPHFIRMLNARDDVKVKSVWDHDIARAGKRAPELKAQVVADVSRIWQDPQIDGVVICSETNRHLDLVLAGAAAKKHLFVEKPLGITARDSQTMADAIEKAGLHFTTGYFMRTEPKHLFVKEQVEKGTLGKITRVRGSICHNGSLGGWFDTEWRWMADPKQAGVGAFGDLGTHKLDILMWLLGDVEAVTGQIKVVTGRYGDCDETGEALLKFANGVTGTLAAGWVDVADPMQLMLSGTEGHISFFNGKVYFKSKNVVDANGREPWTAMPSAPPAPLNQFVDAVAGKPDVPLVPVQEAAARVTVMEAIYQASEKRKWVKVKS